MKKITYVDRLRYWFENTISGGSIALIGWLSLLSAVLIVVVSVIVMLAGIGPTDENGQPVSLLETVWFSLMRALSSGTMAFDTGSWPFLLAMLAVTLGGLFVVSTLIGVLASGMINKIDALRRGHSLVAEENHTVILGWSPKVFLIISDLLIANANQPRSCIAILAAQDKVEMEDAIRARCGDTGRTRIVCRTGSPIDLADLDIINPHTARSIVILSPEVDDPDSHVIKTILALTNNPNRRAEPYHIVAEIRDPKNVEVAKMIGRDEAQVVLAGDLIARIAVQTCRQSGLSVVYTELLDFGGDEIYFREEPGLVGKVFGGALLMYEDSALIGLRFADGRVRLNPPMDMRIAAGDRVIAISADDDTVRLSGLADLMIDASAIREAPPRQPAPERTLILGWNQRAATIINELDHYVAPGSEVKVVADAQGAEVEIAEKCSNLRNQHMSFQLGDTADRHTLEGLVIPTYQHVIVLGYSDALGPQEADTRTLITLLHLRDMSERGGHEFSIVSEMLDVRNRELAEVTRADDFIVSDKLVSLMLSQVSENKELGVVFADLFDPEGAELYLKPAGDYVQPGRPVNFYTVVESARRRGQVAIGYRIKSEVDDASRSHGVAINPDKSKTVAFAEEDRVIVLAEG
jgi:voltage-gated potassium channel Kch